MTCNNFLIFRIDTMIVARKLYANERNPSQHGIEMTGAPRRQETGTIKPRRPGWP